MNNLSISALKIFLVSNQRLAVAIGAFIAISITQASVSPGPVSYFEISSLATNVGPLVMAAMGLTIVFLLGGFDLSCGAILSLVNIVVALNIGDSTGSMVMMGLVGIGIGAAFGAFNGFFIAVVRLQPVVVTLATMFMVLGLNLLLMPRPGGSVPYEFSVVYTGDLIPDMFPASLAMILVALLIWAMIKRSRFGTALYAVGSNEDAAFANGVSVIRTKIIGYTLAGAFYGVGGVMLSAQISSGDALVGSGMLILIITAAILGGTHIGGGQGGCLGTVFAAFTLMLVANILLVLNVSSFYTPIVEAVILLLAVLGTSFGSRSTLAEYFRIARTKLRPSPDQGKATGNSPQTTQRKKIKTEWKLRNNDELIGNSIQNWIAVNRESFRLIIPAWTLFVVIFVTTLIVLGDNILSTQYFNSLLTLALFLAILGLGQGVVVMTGGLDLSVPYTLSFAGVLLASLTNGSDASTWLAIPLVLTIGGIVGLFNGLGVAILGMPAIVVTLAANGIMQGLGLLYTGGIPSGLSPPSLQWLFNSRILNFAPAAWFLLVFAIVATFLLHRTTFGRRVIAIGNSPRIAYLSGSRVGGTTISVYMLSGFCSALAGVLMTGFSSVPILSMGLPFLLPAIAVVFVGGTMATGGRGHYLGILGGALLLTAVGTLITGTNVPVAFRDIIFGVVVLGAVLTLRERTS